MKNTGWGLFLFFLSFAANSADVGVEFTKQNPEHGWDLKRSPGEYSYRSRTEFVDLGEGKTTPVKLIAADSERNFKTPKEILRDASGYKNPTTGEIIKILNHDVVITNSAVDGLLTISIAHIIKGKYLYSVYLIFKEKNSEIDNDFMKMIRSVIIANKF
ncbi:MAG TPA: hypothetical protein PLW86_00520 [Rhodocyclaceae bacterium]|nr:hypothetical protein [Rhodocyclaceae bacterium]